MYVLLFIASLYSFVSVISSIKPGPSLLYTFIILFFTVLFANAAAYTARFPPFECPPILIFVYIFFAISFTYCAESLL